MLWSWVRRGVIPPISDSDCRDVVVTHRAIVAMRTPSFASPVVVDVEDCGAAYRFLMPMLAATPGLWLLTGTTRLLERPIMPLVAALRETGAEVERDADGWRITGRHLAARALAIDAQSSSQLASALVLAAPLLGLRTLQLISTDIPSLSYLRMTMSCTSDYPLRIPGVSLPDTPAGAPGDWSAALFWFAYARLHPEHTVVLSPLSLESIQGDSVIAQWFKMLGVSVSCGESAHHVSAVPCVEISAKPLDDMPRMILDVRDNLDTVPVMAALAALLPADITFQNVRNLQYKESDRLHVLAEQLMPYAEIELSENELHVKGKGVSKGVKPVFDTHHDHRLAMAFLLFPGAELNDIGCLEKSYPGLLEQM